MKAWKLGAWKIGAWKVGAWIDEVITILIDARFLFSPRVRLMQIIDGRSFTMTVTPRDLLEVGTASWQADGARRLTDEIGAERSHTVLHVHDFTNSRSR